MHWGIAEISLRLPGVRSLKEKRSIIRPLVARLRQQFPVSLAEVGDQDLHQRARLGVAVVGGELGPLQRTLQQLRGALDRELGLEVIDFEVEYE